MKMYEQWRELANLHETRLEEIGRIAGNAVQKVENGEDELASREAVYMIYEIARKYLPKEERMERVKEGDKTEVPMSEEMRTQILLGRNNTAEEKNDE